MADKKGAIKVLDGIEVPKEHCSIYDMDIMHYLKSKKMMPAKRILQEMAEWKMVNVP